MPLWTKATDKSQWEIQGTGLLFRFPDNFDVTTVTRRNAIEGREVDGKDGAFIDREAIRRESLQLTLTGRIQSDSFGSSQQALNTLQRVVNQIKPYDTYLVDRKNDRRIAVRLKSSRIPREPAFMFNATFIFETTEKPMWEDQRNTLAQTAGTRWADCPLGSGPSDNLMMSIFHPTALFSNPTVIKGNWTADLDLLAAQATAINTNATGKPYGNITGNSESTPSLISTAYGIGRKIRTGASTLTFNELSVRTFPLTWKCTFIGDNSFTAGTQYLFVVGDDGGAAGAQWEVRINASGNLEVLTNSVVRLSGSMPTFVNGSLYSVMGVLDPTGFNAIGTIGAGQPTLHEGMIFVNGKLRGSTKNLVVDPTGTVFDKVWVGTNDTNGLHGNQIFTRLQFWHQNLGEGFCEANWNQEMKPDNKVFKFGATLPTFHMLEVDHRNGLVNHIDPTQSPMSVPTIKNFTGDFFSMGDSSGLSADSNAMNDTIYIPTTNFRVDLSYKQNHF